MLVVKCSDCGALTPKSERTCSTCKQPLAGSVHEVEDSTKAPQKREPSSDSVVTQSSTPEPRRNSSLYEQLGPPWWLVATTAGLLLLYLDKNDTSPAVAIIVAMLVLGVIAVAAAFAYACLGEGTTKNMSYGAAIVGLLLISGMLHDCFGGDGGAGCYEGGRYGEYSSC